MADRITLSKLDDLRRLVREKESELSALDLMLADYYNERSRLIRELRRLLAQLREAEEADSSFPLKK